MQQHEKLRLLYSENESQASKKRLYRAIVIKINIREAYRRMCRRLYLLETDIRLLRNSYITSSLNNDIAIIRRCHDYGFYTRYYGPI